MKQQQVPHVRQRCHCEGIGFGTILQIKEVEREGLRTKITTRLKIRFDTGLISWKCLSEVELVDLPDSLNGDGGDQVSK